MKDLKSIAVNSANQVKFLANREEFSLYASAVYFALEWAKKIDERNKIIKANDKSVHE